MGRVECTWLLSYPLTPRPRILAEGPRLDPVDLSLSWVSSVSSLTLLRDLPYFVASREDKWFLCLISSKAQFVVP